MQINVTTDYAIRVLLSLNSTGHRVKIEEISDSMKIPYRYLNKVLSKLKNGGIVKSYEGLHGGYELTKDLKEISLWEVLNIMENTVKVNRCLEEDKYCSRNGAETCPVRKFYCNLQYEIEKKAKSINIFDMANT